MEHRRNRAARIGRGTGLVLAGAVGATALTGISFAQDSDAESSTTEPASSSAALVAAEDGADSPGMGLRPGEGMGFGHGFAVPGTGPILHGDSVVRTDDGEYANISVQSGTITAVSETSITVQSEDGYRASYPISADTKVRVDHERTDSSALAVGRPARVIASEGAALRIGSTTPEGQSQFEEKAAGRSEIRDLVRERIQERLRGTGIGA